MKKIGLIILFIFLFFIQAEASTWRFVWDESTTTIEVPLGSTLQNYIHIPKARLYKDQKELSDAVIEYIPTGDWLYVLTDVDTSKVGDYQVWYKVLETKYRPGQCQGYKTLITFKVVDKEPPLIHTYPATLKYLIGMPVPDYQSHVIAVDNSGFCEVSVDDSLVRYDVPGNYPVYIQANDGYNITMVEMNLEVEDPVGPVITFKGENNRIVLARGELPDIKSFFLAYDQVDGDVTNSIQYKEFDTEKEQTFDLEVFFYDQQRNSSSYMVTIDIVNQDEIDIELYHKEIILDYNTDLLKAFKANLKKAMYGKRNVSNEIQIDVSSVKNEVGHYTIQYIFSDQDKTSSISCEVTLLASIPPILLVQNIAIPVGQKPNYLDYITVQDPSDLAIGTKIQWDDSKVEYAQAGTYVVNVSVVNSSNLSTTETIIVTIYEKESSESFNLKNLIFICIGVILFGIIGVVLFFKYNKRRKILK